MNFHFYPYRLRFKHIMLDTVFHRLFLYSSYKLRDIDFLMKEQFIDIGPVYQSFFGFQNFLLSRYIVFKTLWIKSFAYLFPKIVNNLES